VNTKPLPDLNDLDTGFFWQGTARDTIHVKRCADCGRDHWPPRLGCPYCGSAKVDWTAVRPRGEIFSWTMVHRSMTPGFATPYAVVLVALSNARGVRMIGNLLDCAPEQLCAGLAVEAVFTPSEDGSVKLVHWRPVRDGQS
jgi:uncharacterized OB-fold protein